MSGNGTAPRKYCKGCEFCTCETKRFDGKKKLVYETGCSMIVMVDGEKQTVVIQDMEDWGNGKFRYLLDTEDGRELEWVFYDTLKEMLPD